MILKILSEPAILVITAFFIFFVMLTLKSYIFVKENLNAVYGNLHRLNKKELSYRFKELDDYMCKNPFTATSWEDFKKALIFPEKLYLASQSAKSGGEYKPDIYLTIDASYFFNEESLIYSKINHKFIQTMPTLLTGLGPFFTFLKMAIAFAGFNLSMSESAADSLNGLIASIQIAALCSVFAVGFSLAYMFIERILYNRMCKKYYLLIQNEFVRLFDVVTSEKFLIDLVHESKVQHMTNEKLLKSLPDDFAKAVAQSIGEITVPYLENFLYSLNKLNENFSKNQGNSGDIVDKLF